MCDVMRATRVVIHLAARDITWLFWQWRHRRVLRMKVNAWVEKRMSGCRRILMQYWKTRQKRVKADTKQLNATQRNATQGGRASENQCALKQGQDSSCKELSWNILQRINLASNFQKQNAITAVILVFVNRITIQVIQARNYAWSYVAIDGHAQTWGWPVLEWFNTVWKGEELRV